MAVLPIRKFGDEVLRVPTAVVTEFDGHLQKFVDDMVDGGSTPVIVDHVLSLAHGKAA